MTAVLAAAVPGLEVVDGGEWPDVPETGATLEENALLKAAAVVEATGHAAIADDTGLEVDALDGRPGVHTARFAGPDATYAENRARMLAELEGVADRAARFRTVVALACPGGVTVTVEGVLEGSIATSERGEHGFGYDPIFEVGGRTLAEIPETEKNRISHRARALGALATLLAEPPPSR
ncbi:MAG: RdgB/HAM1 family non-canonical purine NTP pyrophosphatase [Actinobacteria bacterium]|nr:RdgB/HAM1 family non-canonical purine NTP pyrophosphatase [Actinomycetota bacterium]